MIIQKLTEDQIKFLETSINNLHCAETGFKAASKWINEAHKKLWKRVCILFPDEKRNIDHLKWDTKEIIILENTDEHAE